MSFGPPAGSPFAGPGAPAGLPFAGMPSELAAQAEEILEQEPDHPEPEVGFDPVHRERHPFGLRRFLAGSWPAVALAAVLVVAETVAGQLGPLFTQRAIDEGIVPGDGSALARTTLAYAAVVVAGAVVGALRVAWTGRVGESLMERLRVRVFTHLQRLSLDYFTGERSGVVMTRMTSDIDNLSMLFQEGLVQIAVQSLAVVVLAVILVVLDPVLATLLLGVVVPALVAASLWFRRASNRGFDAVRDRIAEVLADLAESLGGIRVITMLGRRERNLVHHTNLAGEHYDANRYTAKIGAIYGPGTEALGIVAQAIVLGVGGARVAGGQMEVGELVAFLFSVNLFFTPIQSLVQQYHTYQQGQASIRKLRDLLATAPSVPEAPDAVELGPISGAIGFDGVSFAYEPGAPVLEDVDLTIAAGETFALVGPTGAGKSTMAKLVTRFIDPDAGRVTIDGVDLRAVTLRSLRRQLGVVPQEPFLFSGSIRQNLAFAAPAATDDELWAACEAVGLAPMLRRSSDGLDTPAHERGASFSAGERQLLALARAFLAQPRVLVLDEATSSLDLRSEQQIEEALDVVLEGRTAIIIAHRLATAMRADRIAVVDERRVVEVGTHDELVHRGGPYAAMYRTWMRHAAG